MPAKPLTDIELAEAASLKRLFDAWQQRCKDANEPCSQEVAATRLGFGQSALSQYLNGRIPLNIEAAVSFARVLGVVVDQFSPTIAEKIRSATAVIAIADEVRPAAGPPAWISEEAYRLLDLYYATDNEGRYEIMSTAAEQKRGGLSRTASNEA